MQLTPLSTPNVSSSKFKVESASFALKTEGSACVSWTEDRNGEKGILYRFWDGLEWAFCGDSPIIDKSYSEIVHSNRSLALKNNVPMVVYGRNEGDYKICIAKMENNSWTIAKTNTDKKIKWIGIHFFGHPYQYSSSSSSSLDSSSSSSSKNTSSSSSLIESSSSSSKESSSSSSFFSSSSSSTNIHSESSSSLSSSNDYSVSSDSSSQDSNSTSSSSSYLDENIRIVMIDEDGGIHVYGYDGSLILLSSSTIGDWNEIKTTNCDRHIGVVKELSGALLINFFDILTGTWAFGSMQPISNAVQTLSFDICGTNEEDNGVCFVSWNDASGLKVAKSVSDGTQTPYFESYEIVGFATGLSSDSFKFNTMGNVAISVGRGCLLVFTVGSQNTLFTVYPESVERHPFDIIGQPLRYFPTSAYVFSRSNLVKFGFVSQSDVYYVEGEIDALEIPYTPPELTILNSQRYKYGLFHPDEGMVDFMERSCTWNNRAGDMLAEATRRVVVAVDDGEDPFCATSSSESSVQTETINTSFSYIDDGICGMQISSRGGIAGYYKEFITQPFEQGCTLTYHFTTYVIKDRLIITFYDEFDSILSRTDTGCIATSGGRKSAVLIIPMQTVKTTVQVLAGCDPSQPVDGTAWTLLTYCACDSSSSLTSDSSLSSLSNSSDSTLSSLGDALFVNFTEGGLPVTEIFYWEPNLPYYGGPGWSTIGGTRIIQYYVGGWVMEIGDGGGGYIYNYTSTVGQFDSLIGTQAQWTRWDMNGDTLDLIY